jgi:hypothetical protein
METFDHHQDAVLHDGLHVETFTWTATPELVQSWERYASRHAEGVIEWYGLLLDGWKAA